MDAERSYGQIEDGLSPLFTDAAQLLDALPVEYRFYCNDMHVAASEYSRSDAGHGVKYDYINLSNVPDYTGLGRGVCALPPSAQRWREATCAQLAQQPDLAGH
eukprot:m.4147 g.4147  ORF g.4147 m.4147 type:complete len:103 (-) comp2813_c0_seq2:1114-1422(-)